MYKLTPFSLKCFPVDLPTLNTSSPVSVVGSNLKYSCDDERMIRINKQVQEGYEVARNYLNFWPKCGPPNTFMETHIFFTPSVDFIIKDRMDAALSVYSVLSLQHVQKLGNTNSTSTIRSSYLQ